MQSSNATAKTVRCRSKELEYHREQCSGGDHVFQLSREVRACSLEDREEILKELQDGCAVHMPTHKALAMKADLCIPWSKLRAVRRSDVGSGR